MKIALLCFAFLGLCASPATGQTYVDLVRLEYDHGLKRPFENSPGESGVSELILDLTLPVPLKSGAVLLTGLNAERIANRPGPGNADLLFYGLSLKLGAALPHSGRWSGTYLLLPRYAAAPGATGEGNFQLGLLALLKRTATPNKNLRFGLYANAELFGPFVVPLFGYYLKKGRWETNLLLPLSAEVNCRVAGPLALGVKFVGIIKSYAFQESFDGYLAKANNELGLIANLHLGKVVWQLNAGTTIGRSWRTYRRNDKLDFAFSALKIGDERVQQNDDFRDGFFLKTGLFFRIPTN